MNDYEDRKIAKNSYDWGFISTARVTDGRQPYETAVKHPGYRDGEIVIVEAYDDPETARAGHEKWVGIMKNPPDELTDCNNSYISQLYTELGEPRTFKYKPKS